MLTAIVILYVIVGFMLLTPLSIVALWFIGFRGDDGMFGVPE